MDIFNEPAEQILGRSLREHGDECFGAPGFTEAEIARECGLSPYQVALAWPLSRPAVASVIVEPEKTSMSSARTPPPPDILLKPDQSLMP